MDKTGGPAFPRSHDCDGHNGMTLRDYFAAKAMQGMLATDIDCSPEQVPSIVESAYILADAMLAERNK